MADLATVAPVEVTRQRQNFSCFIGLGQHVQNGKIKTDQLKKMEFIRTGQKLKHELLNIEKDKNNLLFNKKSDFRMEYSTLEELEYKLTKNQKAEKTKIQQKLAKIHNNVQGLQRQLKDVKPTPEFVDGLREIMEEVETAINTFKEEQRQIYEELMREEKTATNDLNALEKKIEMWALGTLPTERILKQDKVPLDKEIQNNLPGEVLKLERFLQKTGGRQGGWDEFDHQVFLRLWRKHKGKPSCIDEALDCFTDRTREDIQQHEKWYQEYLILEAQKKESIKKWKMKKQQEKKKMLTQKERPEKVLSANMHQREEAQKQKAEEDRKKRLEELKAWKRHKTIEYAMKQAAQLKEEEEKETRKQRERQRQFQMKLLLEKYTRQKKEQEELLRLEKERREEAEKEERKRTAAEEILKFQERVEINVTRDPYRLYKPTKVWEERTKEIGPQGSVPLLHIPHKGVPSWRQGL
ncbi:coiled-coil domain-containing protein 112 isoform X2 [Tiliqua scincoides]|uniref:coiled-coil domain-containing protein 112 isoform X2 n=1 Tax=Tiliqua scincoides TaxID=71010 RepID=UPI0034636BAC